MRSASNACSPCHGVAGLRGVGEKQQAIGLAQTQVAPVVVGRAAEIDDKAHARFEDAEPAAGLPERGFGIDQRAFAVATQCLAQAARETDGVDAFVVRQNRESARRGKLPRGAPLEQSPNRNARGFEHRLRLFGDQRVETVARQTQQFRIAQGAHGGRARLVDHQAQFADRFARRHHTVEMEHAARIGLEGAEASGLQHVQGIRRIADVEQRGAAGHGEPFQFGGERIQFGVVEMAEQRETAQQRARVEGLAGRFVLVHPRPSLARMLAQIGRVRLDFGAPLHHVYSDNRIRSPCPTATPFSTKPRFPPSRRSSPSTCCRRYRLRWPTIAAASMR